MILLQNVTKGFEDILAVNDVSLEVHEGSVFGLLGTNGAGKSTLLRMIAGVIQADKGQILVDGQAIWNQPEAGKHIFYISDEQFYFPNVTAKDMARFYKNYYPDFEQEKFCDYLERFELNQDRKIKTFSKGMKKQVSILLGICTNVKYLLCDETFDGLDPVMRQGIKSIFAQEIDERGFTPIIASHNLRELEDICDSIGVLHRGGILLSKDMGELKDTFLKVQCVLPSECDTVLRECLDIVKMSRHGRLLTMTVRGRETEILEGIKQMNPVYYEALPLTLEEIFISEMEVVGYDIKNLVF